MRLKSRTWHMTSHSKYTIIRVRAAIDLRFTLRIWEMEKILQYAPAVAWPSKSSSKWLVNLVKRQFCAFTDSFIQDDLPKKEPPTEETSQQIAVVAWTKRHTDLNHTWVIVGRLIYKWVQLESHSLSIVLDCTFPKSSFRNTARAAMPGSYASMMKGIWFLWTRTGCRQMPSSMEHALGL